MCGSGDLISNRPRIHPDSRPDQPHPAPSPFQMLKLNETELMTAIAAGDEAAFCELLRRHQNLVYGTVYKMLGQQCSDAEDVSQQVFIKVYRAASRYRPQAKFTTWLLTICRNCTFTHLKRGKRHLSQPLFHVDETGEHETPLPDPDALPADQLLLHREMQQTVEAAVARLPLSQREALILRQYHQLDYEEIARVMKTSVSSVKSLLFRARDVLRQELKDYLEAK